MPNPYEDYPKDSPFRAAAEKEWDPQWTPMICVDPARGEDEAAITVRELSPGYRTFTERWMAGELGNKAADEMFKQRCDEQHPYWGKSIHELMYEQQNRAMREMMENMAVRPRVIIDPAKVDEVNKDKYAEIRARWDAETFAAHDPLAAMCKHVDEPGLTERLPEPEKLYPMEVGVIDRFRFITSPKIDLELKPTPAWVFKVADMTHKFGGWGAR